MFSPTDSNKNNNCNITVNKPPIIDFSFHQNKTGDKSIDVILGRLSLSLSVPFCERLALFILECLPKDNIDLGIINHGYIGEAEVPKSSRKATGLTVALRINKPEFIFVVETVSNKRRYFITKAEILSDYSRHNNYLSQVLSLSGVHTLFYDFGINASTPYIVLKRCDIEFSKSFSEEKGEKVSVTLSSVNIQLCSRIVHSINDILNDIVEHFRIPDSPNAYSGSRKVSTRSVDAEDLWEIKKIGEFVDKPEIQTKIASKPKVHELLLIPKTEVMLILELENIPVLILKSTLELTMCDWSSVLYCTSDVTLQANYFNEQLQVWEPLIDPTVGNESDYVPWDVHIKLFHDKSLPILQSAENKSRKEATKKRKTSCSPSSTEDEGSEEDMVYMEPSKVFHNRQNRGIKTSLSTFLDESDSENDEGAMEKLASAISDLFTG